MSVPVALIVPEVPVGLHRLFVLRRFHHSGHTICEIIVAITILYEFLVYIEVMFIYSYFYIGVIWKLIWEKKVIYFFIRQFVPIRFKVIWISVPVVPIVPVVSVGLHVHCACCTRSIICGIICSTRSEITSEIMSRIRSGFGSRMPIGITSGFTIMFMCGIKSSIR